MISPWMENGTLPEYIEKEPDVDRLGLCHQIVKGLSYLHQHNMVHGDLKGANVFVSATGILKLADFGNTKMKEQTLYFSTRTSPVYSLRWTAPEILNGSPCDVPADIYALGMTIYETVTGSLPYSDKVDMVVVIEVIVHRRFPSRNDEAIRVRCNKNRLWNLLKSCWNHTPTARPKITNVEEQIKLLMNELATVNEERTFLLLHKFRQAFRNPPRRPATPPLIADSISLRSAAAPSVEEEDSEPGLISSQDASIMAEAFRQMMRKPDLTMRPDEEGESPEDKYVREQAEMIKEQLLEDGKKIIGVRRERGVSIQEINEVDIAVNTIYGGGVVPSL
ncbi:hypothetical protein FRC12_021971 [Ceratobasidium sp. 428]|nr:hypothetical protein FRC12_021971 [Ceratobasidium sp. 428]